jgi:hypothetical protein
MKPRQHTLQREKALNSQQTKQTAEKTGLLLQRAEQTRTLKTENKKEQQHKRHKENALPDRLRPRLPRRTMDGLSAIDNPNQNQTHKRAKFRLPQQTPSEILNNPCLHRLPKRPRYLDRPCNLPLHRPTSNDGSQQLQSDRKQS